MRWRPRRPCCEPGTNLGFGGGCALGVAHTAAAGLAFVNPDVALAPDWLAVIAAALADPTVGVVGSRLLFPDGRVQHAGGVIRWPLALTDHHGYGAASDDGAANDGPTAPIDYVTGAALGLRRSVWEAVGGFDPAFYPAYFEEVDLCLRVAAAGLAVRYEPRATGTHLEFERPGALGRLLSPVSSEPAAALVEASRG